MDIYADPDFRPHDLWRNGTEIYCGIELYAEMLLSAYWPQWAYDLFWEVF